MRALQARCVCAHAVRGLSLSYAYFFNQNVSLNTNPSSSPTELCCSAASSVTCVSSGGRAIKRQRDQHSDIDRGHVGHAQATRGRPHLLPLRGQVVAEAFFLALEGNPEQAGRPLDSERVAAWLRRPSTLTMLCRCQRLPSTAARLPSLLVPAAHCFRGA